MTTHHCVLHVFEWVSRLITSPPLHPLFVLPGCWLAGFEDALRVVAVEKATALCLYLQSMNLSISTHQGARGGTPAPAPVDHGVLADCTAALNRVVETLSVVVAMRPATDAHPKQSLDVRRRTHYVCWCCYVFACDAVSLLGT